MPDLDREPWSGRRKQLLRRASLTVRLAGELQRQLRPLLGARIERRYAQVVVAALADHEAQPPLEIPGAEAVGAPETPPGHNVAL